MLTSKIDQRVRDQVVAETHGSPLALIELSRELAVPQLAGGFGLPAAVTVPDSAEGMFRRRFEALPAESRRLLLLAAAEPTGDPVLLWRAAARLGIGVPSARPTVVAELAEFGARVRFRHPLARSAVYLSASAEEQQQAHAALADATDPAVDPDRRAWHLAQAAPRPDEDVAAELESSAGRAQARGGLAAAAAFLERAARLTPDPDRRAARLLTAAQAERDAGAPDAALSLLAEAEAEPVDESRAAKVERLRGQIAFDQQRGTEAARLLLSAARRLEPFDAGQAREAHLGLHSSTAVTQAGFIAAAVALAAVGGGTPAVGYRYALIAALGIAMGIQNAAARTIAVPDLTTTVLTLTITGIAADSALASGAGSKAGRRLVPVAVMLAGALLGAALIRHAQPYDPIIIALIALITGAAASRR